MRIDERIYGLAKNVIRACSDAGITVGTAESCTGGLVCGALTAVPGSSAVVRGGVVSYATAVKESVLGVPTDITREESVGVVSEECARAMSEGARDVLGCDVAVSVTGIAGPGGGEPGKPVGTVWFGFASSRGTGSQLHVFEGDRAEVRRQAVEAALELLLREAGLCQRR